MGTNIEFLRDRGLYTAPAELEGEALETYENAVEHKLESMRRAEIDLAGEHLDLTKNVLSGVLDNVKQRYDIA